MQKIISVMRAITRIVHNITPLKRRTHLTVRAIMCALRAVILTGIVMNRTISGTERTLLKQDEGDQRSFPPCATFCFEFTFFFNIFAH